MKAHDSQDEYVTQITKISFDMVMHTAIYLLEEAETLSAEERFHLIEGLKRKLSTESQSDCLGFLL